MHIIGEKITVWYAKNKRALPWRLTKNPYKIWVSEIILQQTRIEQGTQYYYRFLEKFHDIHSLAASDEQSVLNVWQGLGYYSRARNMHSAARHIVKECQGLFPSTYNELLTIKGIGPYTAAAIASIAFNEAVPAIDGNAKRLISRLFNISSPINKNAGLRQIEDVSKELIKGLKPSDYNQAVMDLGSMICKKNNPACNICPLNQECLAYQKGTVTSLPVKQNTQKAKTRYFTYWVCLEKEYGDRLFIYIKKRTKKDIWQNLYDFPLVENDLKINQLSDAEATYPSRGKYHYTHKLSHQRIEAVFIIKMNDTPEEIKKDKSFIRIALEELYIYPIPRLIENFINDMTRQYDGYS